VPQSFSLYSFAITRVVDKVKPLLESQRKDSGHKFHNIFGKWGYILGISRLGGHFQCLGTGAVAISIMRSVYATGVLVDHLLANPRWFVLFKAGVVVGIYSGSIPLVRGEGYSNSVKKMQTPARRRSQRAAALTTI